jgi:hypothetical protein
MIIGGTQDNGTLQYTPRAGVNAWRTLSEGDGGKTAIDPTNPRYIYGEYIVGNVHRSLDGGANVEFISGMYAVGDQWNWRPDPYTIPDARDNRANFIAPFVLDPRDPKRMLVGGQSLWRTNDARAAYDRVDPASGPRWFSIKAPVDTFAISGIAVDPTNSKRIWVCHNNGWVFRTANGEDSVPAWTRVAIPSAPRRFCSRIVFDPRAPQTVYLTFTGFQKGNVLKSADDGRTWVSISSDLPEAPVRALTMHATRSDYLYAGTEVGLFASDNGGRTWSPANQGPTSVSVEDLFWMGKTLVAVTHGRGMFSIDLSAVR